MVVSSRDKGININESLNKGKESVFKFGSFIGSKVSDFYTNTKEKLTNKEIGT